VRARTGARTAIHPADAAHARGQGAEIDDELQVGDKIGPLVVVAASGKSWTLTSIRCFQVMGNRSSRAPRSA
jgi:hypothetical protein